MRHLCRFLSAGDINITLRFAKLDLLEYLMDLTQSCFLAFRGNAEYRQSQRDGIFIEDTAIPRQNPERVIEIRN